MTVSLDIERRVSLSPKECFDLWADPRKLRAWWGPKDEEGKAFRSEIIEWDVREGASWSIDVIAPDGTVYRQSGEMIEVDPPTLIRFSFHWMENEMRGPRTEVSVRFDPDGDGTLLRFRHSGFADEDDRDGHSKGWNECLDRFTETAKRQQAAV